jgi:hypothetical protein
MMAFFVLLYRFSSSSFVCQNIEIKVDGEVATRETLSSHYKVRDETLSIVETRPERHKHFAGDICLYYIYRI